MFRMTVSMSCEAIGDRQWHDLSAVAGRQLLLRLNNYRAYEGGSVMYVAAAAPLTPRLEQTLGPDPARVTVEPISAATRRERLAADALDVDALERAPYLSRIDVRMNDQGGEATAVLDLGADPAAIWGKGEADLIARPRVNACRRTDLDSALR